MLTEYYYNFFDMTVVVKMNDFILAKLINAILGDIRCKYKAHTLITTIIQEFNENIYIFKVDDEIILKSNDVHRAALELSSEIINRFVHGSNGLLFLHAGAVQKENQVLVLIGKSKSGKTSLVSTLINQYGYKFLSDEIVPIEIKSGKVFPFYRALSIRKETFRFLRMKRHQYVDISTVDDEIVRFMSYKNLSDVIEYNRENGISAVVFPHFGRDTFLNKIDSKLAFIKTLECSVNFRSIVNEGTDFIINLLLNTKLYELSIDDINDAAICISKMFEL